MKLSIERMRVQGRYSVNLSDGNGDWIADCGAWSNADAQKAAAAIVARVNAYDALKAVYDAAMLTGHHSEWLADALKAATASLPAE